MEAACEAGHEDPIGRSELAEYWVLTHLPSGERSVPGWRKLLGDEDYPDPILLPYPAGNPRAERTVDLSPEPELFSFSYPQKVR